jgi:hypothetical protein
MKVSDQTPSVATQFAFAGGPDGQHRWPEGFPPPPPFFFGGEGGFCGCRGKGPDFPPERLGSTIGNILKPPPEVYHHLSGASVPDKDSIPKP